MVMNPTVRSFVLMNIFSCSDGNASCSYRLGNRDRSLAVKEKMGQVLNWPPGSVSSREGSMLAWLLAYESARCSV
jgi:hypothetical protein